jgi:uncharacterized membrane protein
MDTRRVLRHLFATRAALERAFPAAALQEIEAAVSASERQHGGEIRVALESALDPGSAWRGLTPRERALEVFATLGVWDTEANNGVLIYVLLADRDVEIVADRGFNGRVTAAEWTAICEDIDAEMRRGRYPQGVVAGVREVGRIIGVHYPPHGGPRAGNELPDRPALL